MMAVILLLDEETIRMFEPLRPYRNVPSLSKVHSISGATEEQAPQALTIHNYLYGCHDEYNTVNR